MSRQYFDFSGLIADYSNKFAVITNAESGYDESGEWQENRLKKTMFTGAIVSFSQSKVLRSDGAITTKYKRLYMQQALPQALVGAHAVYKGQKYTIESETENAEFTGVYRYVLRWVSAFDSV